MGTPEFATETLSVLANSHHKISCVYTQPPKKSFRGQKINPSAVQLEAEQLKLKEKEFLADTAAKADELKLKEKEILTEAAAKADELQLKGEIEGVKVGVDIGKAKDNLLQRTPK